MKIGGPSVQLREDPQTPLYVVQPLPLLDVYRLAALISIASEGLSNKAIVEKVWSLADECMARRHKEMEKAKT